MQPERQNFPENEPDAITRHVAEAVSGAGKLEEAYRKGNVPGLGAALCDMEYHIQTALKLLEADHPYFRASDFRAYVEKLHRKTG